MLGDVFDRATGATIESAVVRIVRRDGTVAASGVTNANGRFALTEIVRDDEELDVRAAGYREARARLTADVRRGPVRIALDGLPLRDIGSTRTTSDGAFTPAGETTTAAQLRAAGSLRVSDALTKLPGVTFSGDALAPGGDAYVSIRGLRPSEGQALLDGHPIGPIGASIEPPDADGTVAGFNYQDAPFFALRSTTATFGSSALPAFGISGVGGSIDLNTLLPTHTREASVREAFGNQGRASTALRATGTDGSLGYALAYGVSGTYGLFPHASVAQTGLRGTDFTDATLQNLTYDVSGDYIARNHLFKLVYSPRRSLSFGVTAYGATSWADKTGEGDNDFNPYSYTLANAPVGAVASCPLGVSVQTNAGATCVSPTTYAGNASGPAGGGPDAVQSLIDQDYDLHVRANVGRFDLAADGFTDRYALHYHRDASFVSGPSVDFLDRWTTGGFKIDADFSAKKNDAHANVAFLAQTLDGDASSFEDASVRAVAASTRSTRSAYLEDTYAPNDRLAFTARALASSSGNGVRVSPYARVTLHATPRDWFSIDAGRSTEDPSLDIDRVRLLPIGALNPDCGAIAAANATTPAYVDIGTGPAPDVRAETSSDVAIGYAHAFGENGRIKLTLYDANVGDRIVTAQTLAGAQLPQAAIAPLNARIASFCGVSPTPGAVAFTLSRSFNAANANLHGIEIGGRNLVARHVSIDYAYDLQTIVLSGIPESVLQTDSTLVNGAQAFDIPRTKATLGATVTIGGLQIALDGHAVGANNPQQLTGYAYADASIVQRVSARLDLDVQIGNVFNSHAQQYGLVGLGVPYATNPYFSTLTAPNVEPFNERFGLAPTSLTASATIHL